jgi:thiosulfate reductase cytochrome b subunit
MTDILRIIKTATHVLLTIVIILLIITGLGITNYQIVESLTLGSLSKLTSYQIHTNLLIPLIILLTVHIVFTMGKKYLKKKNQ